MSTTQQPQRRRSPNPPSETTPIIGDSSSPVTVRTSPLTASQARSAAMNRTQQQQVSTPNNNNNNNSSSSTNNNTPSATATTTSGTQHHPDHYTNQPSSPLSTAANNNNNTNTNTQQQQQSSSSTNNNTNNSIVCEMGALLPFGRPTVAEDGATMMLDTSTAAGALLANATSLSDVPFLEVPEDLQCAICLSAASEPVVTEECGHLFCRACIQASLERKAQCPIDRLPLSPAEIRKDVRTQRKIACLRTRCPNHNEGCQWIGELSDMQSHCDGCEFSVFKCGFVMVGCDCEVTRKSVLEHSKTHLNHHLALLCKTVARLSEENIALRQELDLIQRETHRFTWIVTMFSARRGPFYSRKFFARGLQWYLGVDFEGPDHHAGVYVFAEGHTKRVDFKLVLLNQDPRKDRVHIVNDWAIDYKGKGWGPLKFIDRTILVNSGFLVSGSVRIQVEMTSEPYD